MLASPHSDQDKILHILRNCGIQLSRMNSPKAFQSQFSVIMDHSPRFIFSSPLGHANNQYPGAMTRNVLIGEACIAFNRSTRDRSDISTSLVTLR